MLREVWDYCVAWDLKLTLSDIQMLQSMLSVFNLVI